MPDCKTRSCRDSNPGKNSCRECPMTISKNLRCALVGVLLLNLAFAAARRVPPTLAQNSTSGATEKMIKPMTYPPARKSDQVDDYHGTNVADPYRWLEDLDSVETKEWVRAENRLTEGFLEKISARETIRRRITALQNYERYGVATVRGGGYFYEKKDGLKNHT